MYFLELKITISFFIKEKFRFRTSAIFSELEKEDLNKFENYPPYFEF